MEINARAATVRPATRLAASICVEVGFGLPAPMTI
jgi:hypothetical protein